MPRETHTQTGTCATHGTVQATRKIPESGFPWIINAVRRALASRQPFRCPTCGQAVTTT